MVNSLVTAAFYLAFLAAIIWLILAAIAGRWPSCNPWCRGYGTLHRPFPLGAGAPVGGWRPGVPAPDSLSGGCAVGLKERRLAITEALHVGVLALGTGFVLIGVALSPETTADTGGLLLLAHLLSSERIPLGRLLQERLLHRHRCRECSLGLDLKAPWRCGCGFTSPERHACSPCPQCSKDFAWINSLGYGTSILIR